MDSLSTSTISASQFDSVLPQFRERAPWIGGDLQTLRNFLCRPKFALGAYPTELLLLPLLDGSGDRLTATLHWPLDEPHPYPAVVLIHGLAGCEESVHLRISAAHFLRSGFPVLRLNLRGAGPSRALCSQHYHAGRSQDIAAGLAGLPVRVRERGLVAIGFSLGGSLLLKYLGEAGSDTPLMAAVTVSTPLDLMAASICVMQPRNALYHWYFLRDCRREFARDNEEQRIASEVRSLWEFDERLTAPRGGFASAADYYVSNSARNYLDAVAIPTLLLHAADDPIVPMQSYEAYRWRRNRRLLAVIQDKGGHVGFHDRRGDVWHDRASELFLRQVLGVPEMPVPRSAREGWDRAAASQL